MLNIIPPKSLVTSNTLTTQPGFPPTMYLNSEVASDDRSKAILFNRYFYSIFSNSSTILSNITPSQPTLNSLHNIQISEADVYQALANLNTSKATGADGIGPHILKYCSDALCLPLHHLFCLCLHQCDLPLAWRLHCITPIYKSGDKSSIKNYRPISLLSCTSKVLEQIIYDKSIDFITNRFISRHQFGFLRNRSTSQQLLIFIYSILNSHRSHSSTDAFYLDLRKAFDTVSHPELLLKLSAAGITGDLWKWFRSYLTNRSQQVSINGSLSYSLPVSSGVPQGSILGPLLFLVYVNDLPTAITTSQLLMFADDTKCFSGISSALDPITLQSDLNAITSWCTVNKLSLNEAKCVYLRFFPTSNLV